MKQFVRIAPEVRDALASGRPVVALETAAVTHGLPREPLSALPAYLTDSETPAEIRACFGPKVPAHRALGHALAAAVRAEGAIPATVGVLRGQIVIGLTSAELDELANARSPHKVAARDAALVASRGGNGGTTVAGTLLACKLALPSPIRVFATGGIGGVHRGYGQRPDISADLMEIRDSGVLVVTAGAKSILDLPATVEMLDTLGVPMLGLATPFFPRFLSAGNAELRVNMEVQNESEAAQAFASHRTLQPARGMLLCVPPIARFALPLETMERAIADGLAECQRDDVRGPEVTPVLLAAVARATMGASLATNLAVLLNNARVGARVATMLARAD
ncbi:MAG: pseudouridine-5'-phosphate glycosidase [Planctomycetota bacterium]|nr:MAG: pseudouridine-5'-phosphate glycosidase [Planctomycetota bacterium]